MRVLWISHVYPRDAEDIQGLFLHRLAREMPSRGIEVRVVSPLAPDAKAENVLDGVTVRRFRYAAGKDQLLAYTGEMHRIALRRPVLFVRFVNRMMAAASAEAEQYQPDLIHGHWWFPGGLASRGPSARLGVPFIVSTHGTDVRLLRRFLVAWPMAHWVFGGADRVLPVSDSLCESLRKMRLPLPPTDVLPMPADDRLFRPSPMPDSGKPASFVVPARLVAQKRIDVAIRALAWARDQGVDATLELVGEGEKRGELLALTRALGVEDRVTFHGFVAPEEVERQVAASRAVVLPSENEGYGLVLVEAALGERAAIGVRSGAVQEFVVPGETGFLVDPGDFRGLGRAIAALAADPALALSLGRAARRRAEGRTAGPLADRLAAIYRELVSSGVRARGSRMP